MVNFSSGNNNNNFKWRRRTDFFLKNDNRPDEIGNREIKSNRKAFDKLLSGENLSLLALYIGFYEDYNVDVVWNM